MLPIALDDCTAIIISSTQSFQFVFPFLWTHCNYIGVHHKNPCHRLFLFLRVYLQILLSTFSPFFPLQFLFDVMYCQVKGDNPAKTYFCVLCSLHILSHHRSILLVCAFSFCMSIVSVKHCEVFLRGVHFAHFLLAVDLSFVIYSSYRIQMSILRCSRDRQAPPKNAHFFRPKKRGL